ncbi:MAG: DUF86 domain-containing protein [Deltaproteobacteria bacterium]|nr:DUF86 domain-containing protein [Deltaproteobacteria bacterium]
MKKDPLVYIDDIRDSIEAIKRYTAGLTKEDFFSSTEKQDAVYRRLEVIGEAANRLPDEFRNQYSLIPWPKIVGMRNVLIHIKWWSIPARNEFRRLQAVASTNTSPPSP